MKTVPVPVFYPMKYLAIILLSILFFGHLKAEMDYPTGKELDSTRDQMKRALKKGDFSEVDKLLQIGRDYDACGYPLQLAYDKKDKQLAKDFLISIFQNAFIWNDPSFESGEQTAAREQVKIRAKNLLVDVLGFNVSIQDLMNSKIRFKIIEKLKGN